MIHYPLAVTLDTNVFYAAKYDIDEGDLVTLLDYVKRGKVQIYLSDIVMREA